MLNTPQHYTRTYSGIGSRQTPDDILLLMTNIASQLYNNNYTLYSGGANGADKAFELGAGNLKKVFVPWSGYNGYKLDKPIADTCYEIASKLHPAWDYLNNGVKALMARNVHQILGEDLKSPVEFVICWTPDGCSRHEDRSRKTGGTGLAISLASINGIPVFNLKDDFLKNFVLEGLLPLIERNKNAN